MLYIVKKIMEPDYGCEDRLDDYIAMDKDILLDESGFEISMKISDSELYEKDINEGDFVFLDDNNKIIKISERRDKYAISNNQK